MSCENHKRDIAGISDMKILAEMIGDLHYESLNELFAHLSEKFMADSEKDLTAGKKELSKRLFSAAIDAEGVSFNIHKAWQISKPFMENQKT